MEDQQQQQQQRQRRRILWEPPTPPPLERQHLILPIEVELSPLQEDIINCYTKNWEEIYTRRRLTDLEERYNFQLEDSAIPDEVLTRDILYQQWVAFKINVSLGGILVHPKEGKVRYFYAQWGNLSLFEVAPLITDRSM